MNKDILNKIPDANTLKDKVLLSALDEVISHIHINNEAGHKSIICYNNSIERKLYDAVIHYRDLFVVKGYSVHVTTCENSKTGANEVKIYWE